MSVWVHLRIPVRSRMDLLADKIGAILPLGAAVQLPGLPACPPAASGLGAGPGHDDLGRPVLAQGWGQGAWRPPRTPCVPAHSDPVASVHLLEKTRALPVIEEHRKERGRKGDKQIESGALPPVKAWMVGRQRRFLPFPPEQGRGRSGPRPAPLSLQLPRQSWGRKVWPRVLRPDLELCRFSPKEKGLDWAMGYVTLDKLVSPLLTYGLCPSSCKAKGQVGRT